MLEVKLYLMRSLSLDKSKDIIPRKKCASNDEIIFLVCATRKLFIIAF